MCLRPSTAPGAVFFLKSAIASLILSTIGPASVIQLSRFESPSALPVPIRMPSTI